MAAPVGDESYILDLPLELLQRITSQLDQRETIPSVRLTCKALEAATFDRFVATHVRYIECCVLHKARLTRWRRLLVESPRLANMVWHITFSTCWLEEKSYTEIQLAPTQRYKNIAHAQEAQVVIHGVAEEAALSKSEAFDATLVMRTLFELKDNFSHIKLSYNLFLERGPEFQRNPVHHDLLAAAIYTRSQLNELSLSSPCIRKLGALTDHLKPDLLACTSSLLVFALLHNRNMAERHFFDISKLDIVSSILDNAQSLTYLRLELKAFVTLADVRRPNTLQKPQDIAEKLLRATRSDEVCVLTLRSAVLSEAVLLGALAKWRSKLVCLELRHIRLVDAPDGWSTIMRTIAGMPKLQCLYLYDLSVGGMPWVVGDSSLQLETMKQGLKHVRSLGMVGLWFRGKEEISLGMEELLSKPLRHKKYFEN